MDALNKIINQGDQLIDPNSRSYDFAVSLGTACIVSNKMEKNNLRLFSGPFDWIVGSPERVNYLIRNDFKDFFRHNNLEIEGKKDGKFLVRDKLNGLLSVHDFQASKDNILVDEHKKVMDKYNRRIKKFYNWSKLSEKALFIIFINSEEDFSEAYGIKEAISLCFPQLHFDLLVVHLSNEKISKIKYMDGNLYLAYIYHDENDWSKSDLHWKNVLNHFNIDFSKKTIEISGTLPLNKNRLDFKNPENNNKFVYLGLSHHETHGRWSIGDKTRIGLRLETKPKKMVVKCTSYMNRSSLVYANGKCIGSLDFTNNNHLNEFDMKDIDVENHYLIVDFIHETPISPLSEGKSSDSRMISVLFNEILFQ